jgi:Transglycosylase SLT domain
VQFVSRPFRLIAGMRPAHRPKSTSQGRRIAVALTGVTAALAFGFAASAVPTTAHATTWLRYQSGYSVQGSWLCYGWSSGTYHCTQHWSGSNGRYVSLNASWVPNVGSSSTASNVDADGDHDGDTSDGAPAIHNSAPVVHASAPVVHASAPVMHASAPAVAYSAPAAPSSSGSVQGLIQSAFGAYAGQALRVAACESGYNPNAVNASSGATGVFQFLYSTWLGTPYAKYSRTNAWANVNAAHYVFARDGNSWREWTCQP